MLKTNKINKLLWVEIFLVGAASLLNVDTVARYANQYNRQTLYVADQFYFDSDMLSSDLLSIPIYDLQESVNNITFTLTTYPFGDSLNKSNVDVTYDIVVNNSNGEIVFKEIDKLIRKGESNTISIEQLQPDVYTVFAKTKIPYLKTIAAKFVVTNKNSGLDWSIDDTAGKPLTVLTIKTESYGGNVLVSWPDGFIPNRSLNCFENLSYEANSHVIKMNSYSEYQVEFFKNGDILNNDYSQEKEDGLNQFIVDFVQ